MARKLIGTAVTDENGEATITYTGTGAGKLNIVAESGTFLQETYEVYDCTWIDKSDATWSNGTYASFSNGVRTFNNTSSGEVNIYANNDNIFTGDLICEFDVNSFSTDFYLRFYVEFGRNYISSTDLSISENNHVMIKVLDKNCAMYVNGTLKRNFDFTSNGIELGFRLSAGGTLNISNYKVYPI